MSRGTILLQIHKDLLSGQLKLPALPQVSLNIKNAATNPKSDITDLSLIAQTDPAFCGYLVHVANSPIYRGIAGIQNVQQAISRLGMENTKNMAMNFAVRNLFAFQNKQVAKYLEKIWSQSTFTAAIAYVMAQHIKQFDPDEAILASLLQNIGTLPLLDKASLYQELMEDEEEVGILLNKYSANLGAAVLKHWGMAEQFQEVSRARLQWRRDSGDKPDLADLVTLARFHSLIGTPEMKHIPRINELPAFRKFNLDEALTPEDSFEFIESARELISQTQSALGGTL